jgi:hypothetical protein
MRPAQPNHRSGNRAPLPQEERAHTCTPGCTCTTLEYATRSSHRSSVQPVSTSAQVVRSKDKLKVKGEGGRNLIATGDAIRGKSADELARQRDRRNLTKQQMTYFIAQVVRSKDRVMRHGGDRRSADFKVPMGTLKGKTADELARQVSSSEVQVRGRTIERVRAVLASDEEKGRLTDARRRRHLSSLHMLDCQVGMKTSG